MSIKRRDDRPSESVADMTVLGTMHGVSGPNPGDVSAGRRSGSAAARRRFQINSPRQGDQRRELILDSAETLLKATPIAELTMEMIASAASLSRTSVYFYFGSKAEAVDAVIARASDEMREQMYNRTAEESLADFVARILTAALDGWRRHRSTFVAAVDLSSHANDATTRWREIMRVFVATLADAVLQEHAGLETAFTEAEAEQSAEIVCWMVERNFYFLFAREHTENEEDTLAAALTRAALAVFSADIPTMPQ